MPCRAATKVMRPLAEPAESWLSHDLHRNQSTELETNLSNSTSTTALPALLRAYAALTQKRVQRTPFPAIPQCLPQSL